ncbi:hybrid-cluster NAD(P)-dependent oxidoreductase [Acuticoccus sp. I52.16.1]|uniref:hybrid-cluster NAD(P)-dependent oxidoreductase n=1 Tax=Acuticoccus sp. I52.16.1 TaxID=2928472 RepID=UPI001FD298D6|nr:hybrid-cluster NAD(P)-dependent oxidoreductase [Acuticoccus sp. I52.16.1]UOM34991.1 hybrid-cluster NAD(P)-dependent oxidoreductase [Acuticoccus sp. I52.16.1]
MRCLAAWDETHDVRSFLLAPEDGGRIAYSPGQFITLRVPGPDGEPVERCYTLSSSAAGERTATITVKKKPGGVLSGHLHATLTPGTSIEVFGPSGQFGPAAVDEKYLLLSAGSGVTPMLSVIRTAADLGIDLDATFLHAARTEHDLIARDDLAAFARRLPRLRLLTVASRANGTWAGERGRLDTGVLGRLVSDLASRTVLCCGPEGFMAAMREACLALGVAPNRYFEESFDFGEVEVEVPADGPLHRITFAKSGKTFDCPENLTILQAARLAGVPMPSSCAKGVCGTCKCMKTSGSVDMNHGGGIRDREVARGFILPCSSRPLSDIVLDR